MCFLFFFLLNCVHKKTIKNTMDSINGLNHPFRVNAAQTFI